MTEHAVPHSFPSGYLDEYRGNEIINYAVLFLVLSSVSLGLRFWSRWLGHVRWGLDDTCIVASAVSLVGLITACLCDVIYGGVGFHAARVMADDPRKLVTWAKMIFVLPFLYLPAVSLPKLSVLALYLRVFGTKANPIARTISWITVGIVVSNCLLNILVTFFMCRPIAFLWNRKIDGGSCLDINAWWRWGSLANIVTDVIMLFLPIPTIMRLQAPKKVKAGLAVTFITGSIGLATAILRFQDFFRNDIYADPTWTAVSLIIVTIAEPGLYFIAACLLALRPLMKWSMKRVSLSTLRIGRSSQQQSIDDGHIMQKITFKVTQSECVQHMDDLEDLIEANGHRAEISRATE